MLPRLDDLNVVQSLYLAFIDAVKAQGFKGELSTQYSTRTVLSTDNSIYQVLPQAIIYPKSTQDIQIVCSISNQSEFHKVKLSPRGGGTGTNGQSLTDGVVVDLSRHMNSIIEINADEGYAIVETGVVKDQLNQELKKHGLFFAPELSTSNRATIGGMINTDASGQGSVMYGKTRDHVLELSTVLLDGSLIHSRNIDDTQLNITLSHDSREANIYKTVNDIYNDKKELIKAKFPPLNRCLTGYDLAHIKDEQNQFNLNNILCGSEGTLGFIVTAKINVLPIPKFSALVNVCYDSFENSMRDAQSLMAFEPTSIETVDSRVLGLAKNDIVWHSVSTFFPEPKDQSVEGINLIEYTSDSLEDLEAKIEKLLAHLNNEQGQPKKNIASQSVMGTDSVKKIWAMRKKAVGLLGNAKGSARPIPFVEDTAVPPENLADFIMEFRKVLDSYNLTYGMFGHVDAGVLHVRPAIDMKDTEQAKMVRVITEQVVSLVKKYNGLLWGEHGKGVRSEFSPEFFGELYPSLQEIKAAFDPRNQLNPGKIATPTPLKTDDGVEIWELSKIDEVQTRGELDNQIPVQQWNNYDDVLNCNGNGACFNYDLNDRMCPSYKATRDRRFSPKGRSSLIREWLRLLDEKDTSADELSFQAKRQFAPVAFFSKMMHTLSPKYDFNHEVMDSMSNCLACKSCAGQCPIKVDIPEARARFYEVYYSRYLRPLKDYFIVASDLFAPLMAKMPRTSNFFLGNPISTWALKNIAGMVDSPLISTKTLKRAMRRSQVVFATELNLNKLSEEQKSKSVILVQDAFTSYFDADSVNGLLKCLKKLGLNPMIMPYSPNGKAMHVHGFFTGFKKIALKTHKKLKKIESFGVPLIGMDPSMTLTYRNEYLKALPNENMANVQLIQEWLGDNLHLINGQKPKADTYYLLAHCTEATNAAGTLVKWQAIYEKLGYQLEILNVGCCGMSGTFGHESKNVALSKKIYTQSWQVVVENESNKNKLMATGYSCRSQIKRESKQSIPHPMGFLFELIKNDYK
ncbi:D-2-hydroxyglutarate dehydrogenase YdiJ [Marinicellulosiphila megalodicopiae]|uniref:D-2-hydroxyglutarate dehydrogenase YdiJ n=1 Tax=Marinicellulosiphila megalodicopiae TaxID=2724896 RepID=UPI003BB1D348